ncbi:MULTISPECIES: hypothetical protein [Clostridium]|uniref:Lipoprotein n=1 Tax=Clostridium cibarium TaxID=2762247 RepID=A0ABR8PR56_9CLOT|nr:MULTISPECIES: hypothetical protein [Clostridium]MBD7910615.1 hypothetical protein [Clostridium cibarium]
MSKKIIAIIMSAMITMSFVGCGSAEKQTQDNSKSDTVAEEKYNNLQGEWTKDFTSDEFNAKYSELLKKVEDKTKEYGLKYTKDEVVREENENFLKSDNDKAEKNRLQSLYFGRKIYGEDLSSGQITMKILLNFDGEKALKEGKFNFGDTSLAKYSSIFTGQSNRDYKDINSKIIDTLKCEKGEGVIKSESNGLYEEFTVNKEYIVYKLETKKFKFAKANQ